MIAIKVCKPDRYQTLYYKEHCCLVCAQIVKDESYLALDVNKNEITIYTPSSRYWHLDGVFCSIECGLLYLDSTKYKEIVEIART